MRGFYFCDICEWTWNLQIKNNCLYKVCIDSLWLNKGITLIYINQLDLISCTTMTIFNLCISSSQVVFQHYPWARWSSIVLSTHSCHSGEGRLAPSDSGFPQRCTQVSHVISLFSNYFEIEKATSICIFCVRSDWFAYLLTELSWKKIR